MIISKLKCRKLENVIKNSEFQLNSNQSKTYVNFIKFIKLANRGVLMIKLCKFIFYKIILFHKSNNYFIMKMKFFFNLNILKIAVNLLTQAYLIGKINLSDEKNLKKMII